MTAGDLIRDLHSLIARYGARPLVLVDDEGAQRVILGVALDGDKIAILLDDEGEESDK